MRIALSATCPADALFPQAAIATVQLLERLGHEVVFPRGQTCCGQMHINTGYFAEATTLVRHHVEVFEDADCDAGSRHRDGASARFATSPPATHFGCSGSAISPWNFCAHAIRVSRMYGRPD
jgi:hypothetical protein